MKALIKFFDEFNIPTMQARFSCMDNTNVNCGSHGAWNVHSWNTDGFVGWLWQSQIGIILQALAKITIICYWVWYDAAFTVEVFSLSTPSSQLLAGICQGLQWKSTTASMSKYDKVDFSWESLQSIVWVLPGTAWCTYFVF